MKKIAIAFAALIAAFGISSCNKEQIETPSTDIKLNISVADVEGSATKAAKTAWVAGDKINIWFDDWTYATKVENRKPDMIIKCNGGNSWGVDYQNSELNSRLKASGKLTVVYEGFNDLTKYTFDDYNSRQWFNPPFPSYDIPQRQMIVYKENIPYTFASSTLTANLDSWIYKTKFKVLIKNDDGLMTNTADKYTMRVENTTADKKAYVSGAFILVPGIEYPSVGSGSANYDGDVCGVQESDGIAFYYDSITATNADIKFTIKENGGSTVSYTATNKTVTPGVMTNIAIDHSKFAAR